MTGVGQVVRLPGEAASPDPRPCLKSSKSRKYMGLQDTLAVIAASCAAAAAGLEAPLGERCGLFIAVGFIPFERSDIDRLLEASVRDGRLDPVAFSTAGVDSLSPLLTFRCLPNMPAYHVSANLGIRGPYLVTYPGPGQLYAALEEAVLALEAGRVDVALVGGVAHQQCFLVRHHLARVADPVPAQQLGDGAGVLVLERTSSAAARGARALARLAALRVGYRPHDPFVGAGPVHERFSVLGAVITPPADLGAASLPVVLATLAGRGGTLEHALASRDGIVAESSWELA